MRAGSISRRIAVAAYVLAALVIAPIPAIAASGPRPGDPTAGEDRGDGGGNAELRGFSSCGTLGRYVRRHAEAVSYPPVGGAVDTPMPTTPPGAGGPTTGESSEGGGSGATSTTGTNVQEPGIDEPDIVKSDGSRIYAIADGELRAIDVSAPQPAELGSVALSELPGNAADGHDHRLLVAGDRVLLITQTYFSPGDNSAHSGDGVATPDIAFYGSPRTVLSEIDASDPSAMSVLRTMRLEGGFVDARMRGETARIVLSTFPEYPFAEPRSQMRARGARKLIPNTTLRDNVTGEVDRRRMIGCRGLRRPRTFSGLEMLSVLTFDLATGLQPTDVDTIMTRGETVYGSAESIYVATERWVPPAASERRVERVSTEIHRFAIGSDDTTDYAASGSVPGFMLSQWALSERDGYLRVASTWESPRFDFAERESFVTVLDQRGERLEEIGSVGGLGRGERIYAVRFIGDVGYVVTFREVDPLYTVDLSDPAAPRVVGELKVPGYSAYLHPVGDGLLMGVGQDATGEGRLRGTQASLFDVANPARPSALDQVAFGEGSTSEVEYDHHAFLLHPATGLAVLPLQDYGGNGPPFSGAVGLRVGATGIDEVGRITHPAPAGDAGGEAAAQPAPVRRSLVAEDRLHTLSDRGLMSHDLTTLSAQGFVAFD